VAGNVISGTGASLKGKLKVVGAVYDLHNVKVTAFG
jgi:hypothetical protein